MGSSENIYGVLLFDHAVVELGDAIVPYLRSGPIGQYIYCKHLEHMGGFIALTIAPEQVDHRIGSVMTNDLPSHFVKFVAYAEESNQKAIGFER